MAINITARQRATLERLRQLTDPLRVDWDEARGVARDLRGALPAQGDSDEAALRAFVDAYGELLGAADLLRGLRRLRETTDALGYRHVEYFLQVDSALGPLEVYGARVVVHHAPERRLRSVQSSCPRAWSDPGRPAIGEDAVRRAALAAIEGLNGFPRVAALRRRGAAENARFPLTSAARLVLFPWRDETRLVWVADGYGVRASPPRAARRRPEWGRLFVDARTAEIIAFAPSRMCVEVPVYREGISVTPLASPARRRIPVVHDTTANLYRTRDLTRERPIVVYDTQGTPELSEYELPETLLDASFAPSTDPDGAWDLVAASDSPSDRTASQQCAVDALAYMDDLYGWYDALSGGRAGWDGGRFNALANLPMRAVVHAHDFDSGTHHAVSAWQDLQQVGDQWCAYLAFSDGNGPPSGGAEPWRYGYLAGARTVVAHEYQHAVTRLSFSDALMHPEIPTGDWHYALHEGLSDAFAGFYAREWRVGMEVSYGGYPMRNLEFPTSALSRDNSYAPDGGFAHRNLDHFDDSDTLFIDPAYDRGTILAHCAFLLAEGGVHLREYGRPARLIPVRGLGDDVADGRSFPRAARIWYEAVTHWLGVLGASTTPGDTGVFRTVRAACVGAAIARFGDGSPEHCAVALAFYAVGLQPEDEPYGPNVTFLSWGSAWRRSREYVGMVAPDWSSPDLFVNNGGSSEWNALVNVTVDGVATTFENALFCRVRNVGDRPATNVRVRFEYAKMGTAPTVWEPVLDANGTPQELVIGALPAGGTNLDDSLQDNPLPSASVRWSIPPLGVGEVIDHYCVRATVTSDFDANPHDNTVQSNVAYTPYASPILVPIMYTGAGDRASSLRLTTTLPRSWKLTTPLGDALKLTRGGETPLRVEALPPKNAAVVLEAPYDGAAWGRLVGAKTGGQFRGVISNARLVDGEFKATLAARVEGVGHFYGELTGTLSRKTAALRATARGRLRSARKPRSDVKNPRSRDGVETFEVTATLRPHRTIDIAQVVDGVTVGGVTIQAQVPAPGSKPAWRTPPAQTRVSTKKSKKPTRRTP